MRSAQTRRPRLRAVQIPMSNRNLCSSRASAAQLPGLLPLGRVLCLHVRAHAVRRPRIFKLAVRRGRCLAAAALDGARARRAAGAIFLAIASPHSHGCS